ncbi:hypothetical protein ACFX2I_003171 [Malus domestica]
MKRAEFDASVPDAPARPEKFTQRYTEILDDLNKDLESHGSPPDCILLYRLREQVLRELGFQDIFKKVKDEENAKAMSLFENARMPSFSKALKLSSIVFSDELVFSKFRIKNYSHLGIYTFNSKHYITEGMQESMLI